MIQTRWKVTGWMMLILGLLAAPAAAGDLTVFDEIRQEVQGLLTEYRELYQRNIVLQKRIDRARSELVKKEREAKANRTTGPWLDLQEEPVVETVEGLQKAIEDKKNEVLLLESRVVFLKTQLLDREDREKAWELRLKEARYQRRMLQMDLKLKEADQEEMMKKYGGSLEDLRQSLKRWQEQERLWEDKVRAAEARLKAYPDEIRKMKAANVELSRQIKEKQRQQAMKDKELVYLRDKKVLVRHQNDGMILAKKNQKLDLEEQIAKAEKEYQELENALNLSLEWQARKRKLVDEMVRIDRENQILKKKIAERQARLRALTE